MAAASILREARRRSGWSQRQLAREAGVAASVISAIETGQRDPSVTLLDHLLGALGRRLVTEVRSAQPGQVERGDQLRQALRLASLLPNRGRADAPLRFPRLPARTR